MDETASPKRQHLSPWVGVCSLLTAPIFVSWAFVMVWRVTQGLSGGSFFERVVAEPTILVAVGTVALFVSVAIWQTLWAARLIHNAMRIEPRLGHLLLAIALFVAALLAMLVASSLELPPYPYLLWQMILAWLPAMLAILISAAAMVRSRSSPLLWSSYLLFLPLFTVSAHGLLLGSMCSSHVPSPVNVADLPRLQVPWIMVGLGTAFVAVLGVTIKAWRAYALGPRVGLLAALVGAPLIAIAILFVSVSGESHIAGCRGGHGFSSLHHVGDFYW
jgi:hypothetical protein